MSTNTSHDSGSRAPGPLDSGTDIYKSILERSLSSILQPTAIEEDPSESETISDQFQKKAGSACPCCGNEHEDSSPFLQGAGEPTPQILVESRVGEDPVFLNADDLADDQELDPEQGTTSKRGSSPARTKGLTDDPLLRVDEFNPYLKELL